MFFLRKQLWSISNQESVNIYQRPVSCLWRAESAVQLLQRVPLFNLSEAQWPKNTQFLKRPYKFVVSYEQFCVSHSYSSILVLPHVHVCGIRHISVVGTPMFFCRIQNSCTATFHNHQAYRVWPNAKLLLYTTLFVLLIIPAVKLIMSQVRELLHYNHLKWSQSVSFRKVSNRSFCTLHSLVRTHCTAL